MDRMQRKKNNRRHEENLEIMLEIEDQVPLPGLKRVGGGGGERGTL